MDKDVSKKIVTIPNLLSVFRIALIPLFIYFYLGKEPGDFGLASAIVLVVSGATDLLDGLIARKFNQITELGQILDPIADKLTQAVVIVCIAVNHPENKWLIPLVVIFIIKESCMAAGSAYLIRKGTKPKAAMWFGKVATALFYLVMFLIVIFPQMPLWMMTVMIAVVIAFTIIAWIGYMRVFLVMLKELKQKELADSKLKNE